MRDETQMWGLARMGAALLLVSACSSEEFTASSQDASAAASGGAPAGGAASGGSAGSEGGTATGGGGTGATGSGGSAAGGASTGGTGGGGAPAGGAEGIDAGSSPDASLPCASGAHWCDGGRLMGCDPSTGPYVVSDCAAQGQLCQSGGCKTTCEVGSEGCACNAGGACDPGLECVSEKCEPVDIPPPLAHWEFNGDLTDSSGNGYDATESGTLTYLISTEGTGAVFDDGRARTDTFADPFRSTLDSFTVSLRIRVTAYDRPMGVFGLYSSGSEGFDTNKWLLYLCAPTYCPDTTPGVVIQTERGDAATNSFVTVGTLPPLDTWVLLTLVVSGSQIAYYVDGDLVATLPYTPATTSASSVFLGGAESSETLQGAIDDLRVWDELLDASQVAALAAQF